MRFPNSVFTFSHRTDSPVPPRKAMMDAKRKDIEIRLGNRKDIKKFVITQMQN